MKLMNNLYFYPEQGMLDCNTYVIRGEKSVIVDPGNSAYLPSLISALRNDGIQPEDIAFIVNTHLHIDHCGGNGAFKEFSGAQIALYPVQKENYNLVVIDGARLFGMEPGEFKEDFLLGDSRWEVAGLELQLIPSPGHSPDCVCFYDGNNKVLICGDVLFRRNTGRVDLPGGNADDLKKSIETLSQLNIEYLLPGHMDTVTGAAEVTQNFDFIKNNVFQWL